MLFNIVTEMLKFLLVGKKRMARLEFSFLTGAKLPLGQGRAAALP
jgi:hypothetical protein